MAFKNHDDVLAFLRAVPEDASPARRWRAVKTATRRLLVTYKVPDVAAWKVEALPPQAHRRYGDTYPELRRIRYRDQIVTDWWITDLADVIIHEVAHAVVGVELRARGELSHGGHGPMWRGQMAAMGRSTAVTGKYT